MAACKTQSSSTSENEGGHVHDVNNNVGLNITSLIYNTIEDRRNIELHVQTSYLSTRAVQ